MSVIEAVFGQPFAQQLVALRRRYGNLVPTKHWTDVVKAAHETSFVVSGVMKADLLADIAKAVDRSIAQGQTLESFRKEFLAEVKAHGWNGWTGQGTERGEAWRARVIYETNAATSYAAGRMAQLVAGNYRYWIYKHGNSLEPRPQHLDWDGIALPPDHPFWETHAPPNGWGCTCRIRGARDEAGIRRARGDPGKQLPDGWQSIDPHTGAQVGIDKGWDYKVGGSVAPMIDSVKKKYATLPPEVAADLSAAIDKILAEWLASNGGAP